MKALPVLCLLMAVAPCRAWNDFAHRVAGTIAYEQLTPRARARAAQLLRLNPSYVQWVSGVAPERREKVAFLEACTWADAIKQTGDHRDDGTHPRGPQSRANIGYGDPLEHRYWHFIDLPFSPDQTPTVPPQTPNAQTQIAAFREVIASPAASDALKSYDLVWLLHLVADVHQPLHTITRFSRELPRGDAGGNLILLCRPPCRRQLHGFWDEALGKGHTAAGAIRRAHQLAAADPRLAAVTDERVWIHESFELARREVYAGPIGPGAGPYRITPQYRLRARELAQQRIALAGARLAALLNRELN